MLSVPTSALNCRKCHVGQLVKRPTGYTCDKCGDMPFAGPREKVAPPRPVIVREPLPENVKMTDFVNASKPVAGPPQVLFSSLARPPGSTHILWSEAGSGIRFAVEAPLQVLPPGEPVGVRLLVENVGPYVARACLHLVETGRPLESRAEKVTTGDLAVGTVFDASYTVTPPKTAVDWKVSVLCQPTAPQGAPQDPWKAPELLPDPVPLHAHLATAQVAVAIRSTARCPRCENNMRWTPAQPPKARGWVCEACAHRVESGSLN